MNCNDCINLESVIEGLKDSKHIKHTCTRYKIEVKLTSKSFKDYVVPCKSCKGKDYIKKTGGVIIEKL